MADNMCVCVFHIIRSPPLRETASAFDSTAIAQWHSLSERSLPLHNGVGAAEHPCFRLAVSRIRLFLAAGGAVHVIRGHCRTPWL